MIFKYKWPNIRKAGFKDSGIPLENQSFFGFLKEGLQSRSHGDSLDLTAPGLEHPIFEVHYQQAECEC